MCNHDAIKRDAEAWAALTFRGVQVDENDRPFLELRDCARCASTLAVELSKVPR